MILRYVLDEISDGIRETGLKVKAGIELLVTSVR